MQDVAAGTHCQVRGRAIGVMEGIMTQGGGGGETEGKHACFVKMVFSLLQP